MPFLPIILKWLADPRAWVGIAFAGVLIFAGLEGARLHHAKSDLKAARIELAAYVSAEKAAQAKAKAQDSQAAQITADAARRASDAQQEAQALTAITIKEIPHYVTPNADAHCTVPVGLVRLRDAAATGADLSKVPQPSANLMTPPRGFLSPTLPVSPSTTTAPPGRTPSN